MKTFRNATILALLILSSLVPAFGQELYLINARILDGSGKDPIEGALLVSGGNIEEIVYGEVEPPPGVTVVDLRGAYLLPGLIDAHVHISDAEAAERALRSGVTTARSMGVSHYADVGLGALIKQGAVDGPELLSAGYHIRPTLSSGFFIDHPEHANLMGGVSGTEAFTRVAETNLAKNVDFLKVVATDRAGLPTTDPRRQIMQVDEIRAVVEAAKRRRIPVAAHAHGDGGAAAAVQAGVRSIEHGTYMTEPTLERMHRMGTFLVPTLAVVKDLIQPGGDYDNVVLQVRGRHMYPRLCQTVRMAHQKGVAIVASTDTGYGPNSILRIQHDLEELVQCGLSPEEAVDAATLVAADLLGISERTGRIAAGLEADLIAVEDHPLEDVGALQDVLLVVSDGVIKVNRFYE